MLLKVLTKSYVRRYCHFNCLLNAKVWAQWIAFHTNGNILTDKELHSTKPPERVENLFDDPSNFCVLVEKFTKRKMLRWNTHPKSDEDRAEIVKQALEHIEEKLAIKGRSPSPIFPVDTQASIPKQSQLRRMRRHDLTHSFLCASILKCK